MPPGIVAAYRPKLWRPRAAPSEEFSTEVQQFFDRIGGPPGGNYTAAYETFIDALVAGGVWAEADGIYVLKAPSSAIGYENLRQDNYHLTESGSITFTNGVGVTSGGGFLDSNFNPSTATAPNYTQNDASFGARSETSTGIAGALVGYSTQNNLYPRYTDDVCYYQINSAGGQSVSSADGSGLWVVSRSASSAYVIYRNGVEIDGDNDTSATVQNANIQFLKFSTEHYTGNVTFGWIGGHISEALCGVLDSALDAYLAAVP